MRSKRRPSKCWVCCCGFELNLDICVFIIELLCLVLLFVVFKAKEDLHVELCIPKNLTASGDVQPFNCRVLDNSMRFNETFVCTSFNAPNNDADNVTFAFGVSFSDSNLEFFVRSVADPKRQLTTASINASTTGIKLNDCEYRVGMTLVSKYRSIECPKVGPVCPNTLGFGTKGPSNDTALHPYQMWSMLTSEAAQFDDTLTKMSVRLFDFRTFTDTKRVCANVAQSATSRSTTPFDINNPQSQSNPSNFFRGIKTNICERFIDSSTFTCTYRTQETVIEHVLRVSGYLFFVQLVVGLVVIALKIHYVRNVEPQLDDGGDTAAATPGGDTSMMSKEFKSARVESSAT